MKSLTCEIFKICMYRLVLSPLTTLTVHASEINEDQRLVDPVCSYTRKKIENNKNVYFMHPALGKKWQYANNYFLSANKGGLNISMSFGLMNVSYSKEGKGGYTVPADYSKKSKLKMKETGDVYKITPSSCNPYYDFVEEIEKAYPVYE